MPTRKPHLTRVDRARRHERVVSVYTSGASALHIVEQFGLTESHVYAILRLYGVVRKKTA